MTPTDPPPWYQACQKTIEAVGGVMCSPEHCENSMIEKYGLDYCTCQPPWQNGCIDNPSPNCCQFTQASPLPVSDIDCYCCCGSYEPQDGAEVDSTTARPMRQYVVGDPVYVPEDESLETWREVTVRWTAAGAPLAAGLEVTFGGGGGIGRLVVSSDHPFLMPDSELKPASALVAGEDSLVAADGSECPVLAVKPATVEPPLHQIATSAGPTTSPEGHLIVQNGIVCGDWSLHVGLLISNGGDRR